MLDSKLKADLEEIKCEARSIKGDVRGNLLRYVLTIIILLIYQLQNNAQFREIKNEVIEVQKMLQPTNYVEVHDVR